MTLKHLLPNLMPQFFSLNPNWMKKNEGKKGKKKQNKKHSSEKREQI